MKLRLVATSQSAADRSVKIPSSTQLVPSVYAFDKDHLAIDCLPIPSPLLEYSRTLTPSKILRPPIRLHFSTSWLMRYRYFVVQQPVPGIFTLLIQDLGDRNYQARSVGLDKVPGHHVC